MHGTRKQGQITGLGDSNVQISLIVDKGLGLARAVMMLSFGFGLEFDASLSSS